MSASENSAPPIQVLSTGAPKGGVSGCSAAFQDHTGRAVIVTFVTAPVLRDQVDAGSAEADVIVAPRLVDLAGVVVRTARGLGICLGDD